MKYEEFLSLNEAHQKAVFYDFRTESNRQDQVIIAWAFGSAWRLFEISPREIDEENQFAAIGAGASTAKASLLSRAYDPHNMDVRAALYYVYEAKRKSESVPGVGKQTYLTLVEFNPTSHGMVYHHFGADEAQYSLSEQYDVFGGREFDPAVSPIDLLEEELA